MADQYVSYLNQLWIGYPSMAFRREVEIILKLMRTTQAGKVLVKAVSEQSNYLVILPNTPTEDNPVNAFSGADGSTDTAEVDRLDAGAIRTWDIEAFGHTFKVPIGTGTGKGTTAAVWYSPSTWRELAKRRHGWIPPGDGPAEVLFHEMIHGHRVQVGIARDDAVDGYDKYDDVEEFYAILAANVYRSERGFKLLRRDHWGHDKLEGSLATSAGFYTEFKTLIDTWYGKQAAFCLAMAGSPALFNPFRDAAVAKSLLPAAVLKRP